MDINLVRDMAFKSVEDELFCKLFHSELTDGERIMWLAVYIDLIHNMTEMQKLVVDKMDAVLMDNPKALDILKSLNQSILKMRSIQKYCIKKMERGIE